MGGEHSARNGAGRSRGRRPLLSRALIATIAGHVGRGAFLHVAAEACGVSRRSLFAWLERGRAVAESGAEPVGDEGLYLELLEAVTLAHGGARARAEAAVFQRKPLAWLQFGPGRDQGPDGPGWTRAMGEVRAEARSAAEEALAEALRELGLVAAVPALGAAGVRGGGEEGR